MTGPTTLQSTLLDGRCNRKKQTLKEGLLKLRLAKFRRFRTLLHARAPRNFATAAQLTAPQLRSLWPLTPSPSMSADRFATLSTGRCCRRTRSCTPSLTAFTISAKLRSREMAEDAPSTPKPDDDAASGKIDYEFLNQIAEMLLSTLMTVLVISSDCPRHPVRPGCAG